MIPLVMVVIDEFREGPSKMALAQRHQTIETLVFDRPYEPFGVGVRIGRLHDVHTGFAQQASNIPAPSSVDTQNRPLIDS